MAPDSRAETVPLATALRTGRRSGSGRRKPPEKSRRLAQAYAQALLQPHHPPVNILGGYKFPNAPDVKLREEKEPGFALTASSTEPDDNLDIAEIKCEVEETETDTSVVLDDFPIPDGKVA